MAETEGPSWTHLLLESGQLDDLKAPLRGSARLKYTCLSVSLRHIALGCNTGNVYVFDRNTLIHQQVVFPELDPSPVNVVALSPNEKLVAFSTLNGHVVVMDMNLDKRSRPERLRLVTEHVRTTVTCIQWEHSAGKIYVADVTGKVTVSVVPKIKNLVAMPSDVIMHLESSVVQLDWADDKLLVSTMTRSYICSTVRQQYSQIGKKPREGEYGSCFYKMSKTSLPLIYCARPSSRVWEVDYEGNVLSTHQFKQLLATPPVRVINSRDEIWKKEALSEWSEQGINFPRLRMMGSKFLMSWKNNRLYIFDPVKVKVILWSELETNIQELCSIKNDIYLFLSGGKVRKIQMFSVSQVISILIKKKNPTLAAHLCCNFQETLLKGKWRKHLSLPQLHELNQHIQGTELEQIFNKFILDLVNRESMESDEGSSESYRSRSSSCASVQSYNKVPVSDDRLYTEESHQGHIAMVTVKDTKYDHQLAVTNGDSVNQTRESSDLHTYSDSENNMEVNKSGNHISVSNDQPLTESGSLTTSGGREINNSEDCPLVDKADDNDSDNTIGEDMTDGVALSDSKNGYHVGDSETCTTKGDGDKTEERTSVMTSQKDEDLVPVVASTPTKDGVVHPEKVKRKKKVVTVNLETSKKERKQKTGQKGVKKAAGGGIRRVYSTSEIESREKNADAKVSKQLSLDIYKDDIFATENEQKTLETLDNKPEISTDTNSKDVSDLQTSQAKIRLTDFDTIPQETMRGVEDANVSSVSRQPRGMVKVRSESDITRSLSLSQNMDRTESEFTSSVELKYSISVDSSSLGSSPSQSPLTQSWEGPTADPLTGSSPKISLSSMKDSLQSKFTVTKKKFLKTIKEKNLLSKSPSRDEVSGFDSHTLAKPVFSTIPENNSEKSIEVPAAPKPRVDMSALIDQTETTLRVLSDVSVLGNPDLLKDTLIQWVVKLNQTLHKLQTCIYFDKIGDQTPDPKALATHETGDKCEEFTETRETLSMNDEGVDRDGVNAPASEILAENFDSIREQNAINSGTPDELPENFDGEGERIGIHSERLEALPEKSDELVKENGIHSDTSEKLSENFGGVGGDTHPDIPEVLTANFNCIEDKNEINLDAPEVVSDSKLSVSTDPDNTVGPVVSKVDAGVAVLNGTLNDQFEDMPQLTDSGKLNLTASVLESEVTNLIHAVDPYSLPEDLYHSVSDLAQTCFASDCYGGVSKFVKPCTELNCSVKENSCKVWNDNSLVGNIENLEIGDIYLKSDSEEPPITKSIPEVSSHPEKKLSKANTKLDCNLVLTGSVDVADNSSDHVTLTRPISSIENSAQEQDVCVFVQCYCFMLDMYSVRKKMEFYKGNVFQFWCTYVRCLHEYYKKDIFFTKLMNNEIHYAIDLLKIGNYPLEKTLACVTKLFEQSPSQAIDLCTESPHVEPLDVYYMCQYYSKSVSQYFSPYMYSRVRETMATNRRVDQCYGHPLVRLKWLEILLVENKPDIPLCREDNSPKPGSHKAQWKNPDVILHIFNSSTDSIELEQFLELVQSSGFWLGCLLLLQKLGRREEILTMILQLGDINLFDEGQTLSYIPQTTHEWMFVIRSLHQDKLSSPSDTGLTMSIGGCSDQDECISWDDFAILMLSHLGPVATVTLLQECEVSDDSVSTQFYQSAVIAMLLDRQKRNVTHNLLEKVDSYLWAKKPVTLMPELQYSVTQEKLSKTTPAQQTDNKDKDSLFSFIPGASLPCLRYKEDTEIHWGITTKMTRSCMCCYLPLTEAVSHVEPGVLSFQCGHVYHKLCVPERLCPLC